MIDTLSTVAQLIMAVPVLYVTVNALLGHYEEYLAKQAENAGRQKSLRENARIRHVTASIQKKWVLSFVGAGTLLGAGIGIYKLWAYSTG